MSDFIDSLGESESTRKGMGAGLILDGIIVLIVAIVGIALKRSYEGLNSTTSGIVVIAIAALLLISGLLLMKEIYPAGDIMAWVSAIFSLVFGVLTTFGIIKGDMIFNIYYLLTGVIMIFYLMQRTIRERGETE